MPPLPSSFDGPYLVEDAAGEQVERRKARATEGVLSGGVGWAAGSGSCSCSCSCSCYYAPPPLSRPRTQSLWLTLCTSISRYLPGAAAGEGRGGTGEIG